MLREQTDLNKFNSLMLSLKIWSNVTHNHVEHVGNEKETGTLYRFGWFIINGYRYSISGWKFREGIVTFEEETTGEKIKYDIMLSVVLNKKFKKDSFISSIIKLVRVKSSILLRNISDKLQP